jgi:uridine kinase
VLAAVAAPFAGELYTALSGRPSCVNGHPIRVAPPRPVTEGEFLLYYDTAEPGRAAMYGAAARGEVGRLTILPGSFILNACRTARGAYDAYLVVKRASGELMPWDLAPGALVLAGAGGALQDLQGRSLGGLIPTREALAGAPGVSAEVVRLFGPKIRDPEPSHDWARRNEAVFARLCSRVIEAGEGGLIGVSGAGGGIGKSSFARELAALLGSEQSVIVSLDDYLIPRIERDKRDIGAHDPAATDLALAASHLALLRGRRPCEKPVYDHVRGSATETETVGPHRFVIVEGVMALHPLLRAHLDLTVFLDAPPSVRFRRVARDMEEKGVSEAYARSVHERFEKDCQQHLMPLRDAADVVIRVDESFRLSWVSPD